MRKQVIVLAVCVALAMAGAVAAQAVDLSGRWVGSTQVPNVGEDRLLLELTKDGASYAGTVSDSAGMIAQAAISNVSYVDGTLTFDIVVSTGSATFPVRLSLKADGDTLSGTWATEQGDSATVTLTREKK